MMHCVNSPALVMWPWGLRGRFSSLAPLSWRISVSHYFRGGMFQIGFKWNFACQLSSHAKQPLLPAWILISQVPSSIQTAIVGRGGRFGQNGSVIAMRNIVNDSLSLSFWGGIQWPRKWIYTRRFCAACSRSLTICHFLVVWTCLKINIWLFARPLIPVPGVRFYKAEILHMFRK